MFRSIFLRSSKRRICVVGSGPSGFYSAKYILREAERNNIPLKIDILEKLPVPFGLVRRGVAPDHPEVRAVINDFSKLIEDHPDSVQFYGNVEVGKDIPFSSLAKDYDAVILAHGGSETTRVPNSLQIPSVKTPRVIGATELVDWYNVHPSAPVPFPCLLKRADGTWIENVVVVGHGNVALDVARLLTLSIDELRQTDINNDFISALEKRSVETKGKPLHITVLGRRGPCEASFSNKELREMTHLSSATTFIHPQDLEQARSYENFQKVLKENRAVKRACQLYEHMVEAKPTAGSQNESVIHIKFFSSPHSISDNCLTIEKNNLNADGSQSVPTQQFEQIKCDLIVLATGFAPNKIPGVLVGTDKSNPKGIQHSNVDNRVSPHVYLTEEESKNHAESNVFVTGWARNGPKGNIATQIPDANAIGSQVVSFLQSRACTSDVASPSAVSSLLKEKKTTWTHWLSISQEEVNRGGLLGKPREKMKTVEEMLQFVGAINK